jgi:hypothetical protein
MRLFRPRRDAAQQRHPGHLLISRALEGLASRRQWGPSIHERLLTVAGMVEADPDAGAPAAEALFDILLEVTDQHAGPQAVARLRTSHPAMAVDDLAHGVIDGGGPILDDEAMGVAARLLIALNPARFEVPRFASAEDAFNTYQRDLTSQRRTERFAAREGEANSFWQRQIAKQEDAVRTARAGWRAATEKALAAGESPTTPDATKREAAAARDGEEALELLARRYGRAAPGEIRAAAVAADDGCTLWSALVHAAAQKVLGAQFQAERWESMAAFQSHQQTK